MVTITLVFQFVRGSRVSKDFRFHSDTADFEVETGLVSETEDKADELLDALNADLEYSAEKWAFDDYEVDDYDDDFADPSGFSDLDDYAKYIEKCEEHGEAYVLRYEDIGDFDFNDQYNGCWDSAENFVQDMIESCYSIPDHLTCHIDWESYAQDVMMVVPILTVLTTGKRLC